jgi:tRNA dimethylallyltransferase
MEAGMINEARLLHTNGLSFERMDELGLEYRYLAQYLKKEITKDELLKILPTKIWQYARRQRTWFRRDHGIEWIKN